MGEKIHLATLDEMRQNNLRLARGIHRDVELQLEEVCFHKFQSCKQIHLGPSHKDAHVPMNILIIIIIGCVHCVQESTGLMHATAAECFA